MFKQLIKRLFPTKNDRHSETETKIAVLEKDLAELKILVKEQNQKSVSTVERKNTIPQKAAYFDMIEYFCNSHDDTAVAVVLYDQSGKQVSWEVFSWGDGCGEVTSAGIWKKADEYAENLIAEGMQLRTRKPIC